MLKKRIIPCLDVKNGRTVKGVNFENLRDAGDAVELAKRYSDEGADELVFLDISATQEGRNTVADFAARVAKAISIPFTIGGGITSVESARAVILAGADKVAVNSAAVKRPELIQELSDAFGAQAVVLAIDAKLHLSPPYKAETGGKNHPPESPLTRGVKAEWEVFISGGKISTGMNVLEWAKRGQELGAGEILLTSMDKDGTKSGFHLELTNAVCNSVSIPVIASGGVGNAEHFTEVFQKTTATAALAASVFHFGEIRIPDLKERLKKEGIALR